MIRPLVWVVIWIDELSHGRGTCGHGHATADEATACPWEPTPLPPIGAGLVRQVRDPAYAAPQLAYAAATARLAAARPQLELPWSAS